MGVAKKGRRYCAGAFHRGLDPYRGLGRIAGGYHYFTDTLFSIGLSALLAPFVARWGLRIWQRWYRESG